MVCTICNEREVTTSFHEQPMCDKCKEFEIERKEEEDRYDEKVGL